LAIELHDAIDRTALRDDPPELNVRESVDVGFRLRTFDETLHIVTEA